MEAKIVSKFGEVTKQKLFKVVGDPHWYSTPQTALETHNKMVQFVNNGGYSKRK